MGAKIDVQFFFSAASFGYSKGFLLPFFLRFPRVNFELASFHFDIRNVSKGNVLTFAFLEFSDLMMHPNIYHIQLYLYENKMPFFFLNILLCSQTQTIGNNKKK